MSKNTHSTITIIDPSRWYLSYGKVRKHYMQLHASIWTDAKFMSLSDGAKITFLWICNLSLRENSATLSVCLDTSYILLSHSLADCKRFLMELKLNDIIDLQTNLRVSIKENRIEENKRKAKQSFASDSFDIDAIYNSYPKKQGKASGMKKLHTIIKDQITYDKVLQGAKDYANYCKHKQLDKQYIKQFSTWVNQECWNDDYTDLVEIKTPDEFNDSRYRQDG